MKTTGWSEETLQEWEELYLACERFRVLAPWEWMDDTQLFGVRNPVTREIGWCVVMGNAGEVFGLWIYRGPHGYGVYSLMALGLEPDFEDMAKMDYLSLTFGHRRELKKEDIDLIRESGLRPRGEDAWPILQSKAPWRPPVRLNADEVRYMTLALDQVSVVAAHLKEKPRTPLARGSILLVREPQPSGGGSAECGSADGSSGDAGVAWGYAWVEPGLPERERVSVTVDSAALAGLGNVVPATSEVWEADVFAAHMLVGQGSRQYYPMMLLVVNRGAPRVVHALAAEPGGAGWQVLADSLIDGVKKWGRLPRQIRVKRAEVAEMLGPVCSALGIRVREVEELPTLDRVRREFEESFGRRFGGR